MAPKKTLKRPASSKLPSSGAKNALSQVTCSKRPATACAHPTKSTISKRPAVAKDSLKSSLFSEALPNSNDRGHSQRDPTEIGLPTPSSSSRSSAVSQGRPGRDRHHEQAAVQAPHRFCESHVRSPGTSPVQAPQLMLKNAPENLGATHEQVKVVRGVAVPTAEWQVVPKGVACPAGCEYRMCMSSGVNMVRLLQSGAKSTGRPSNGALVLTSSAPQERPKASAPPVVDLTEERTASRSSTSARQAVQDTLPATRAAFTAQLQQEIQQRRATRTQVAVSAPHKTSLQGAASSSKPAKSAPLHAQGQTLSRISSSSKPALQSSQDMVRAGSSKTKVVDTEYKRRRVDTGKGGLQKEAQEHVRSRALIRRGESGKLSGEKKTLRKEESVQQLEDGRTVLTETITLKKVTVINK